MVDPLLCCLVLLVYSLPLLVVHLAPMADAYSVLRPGAWWRKTGAEVEMLVPGEAFDAARTMMLEHLAHDDVATTIRSSTGTARRAAKAASMSEPVELLYPLTASMLADVRRRGLLLNGDRISVRREVEATADEHQLEFEIREHVVEVRRRRAEGLAVVQVAFSDEQVRSMRYGEAYVADMLARALTKLTGPIPRRS